MHILHRIESVAETSSRTNKERLLAEHLQDPLFAKVCRYAYDPFITFGISAPEKLTLLPGQRDEIDFDLLDRLAARRLTGNAAKQALDAAIENSTAATASVLRRIVDKDLRMGATAKTLNKVKPGLIPSFEVMLAHKFKEKKIKSWPVAAEVKHDGYRALVEVDQPNGKVRFLSRNGKPISAEMPHIVERLLDAGPRGHYWLDGELINGTFNETGVTKRKNHVADKVVLHVFEMLLPEELVSGSKANYRLRRHALEGSGFFSDSIKLSEMRLCHNLDEVMTFYEEVIERGGEGLIVKPLDGLYEPKRSYAWMKIKAQETLDLEVVGAVEGEKDLTGSLGALIVYHNGVKVRVGTGFSRQLRDQIWENYLDDLLRREEADFYSRPLGEESVLGRIVEVAFHEVTPDGSLRHPRFVRFRDDKA